MRIEKLTIRDFRNISEIQFSPDSSINFLIGKNGQGKTSILESIHLLGTLKSFRGSKSDELLTWGKSNSLIESKISNGDLFTTLKMDLKKDLTGRTSKTAYINDKATRSTTVYLSQRFSSFELGFHSICFNPADHEIVRGEPAQRRNYLDRVLAAESVEYLQDLQRYFKLVDQRNAILKQIRPDLDLLATFTEPFATLATKITNARILWLKNLNPRLERQCQKIAARQRKLSTFYHSKGSKNTLQAGLLPPPFIEPNERDFLSEITSLLSSELRAQSTLIGPHRDDWGFRLEDQVLKGHGSQGEVRASLIALKLSEIELFREKTGHRPVLLLDDFSSELDEDRRKQLLDLLGETDLQVFVTTTEPSSAIGKRFWVNAGRIVEGES